MRFAHGLLGLLVATLAATPAAAEPFVTVRPEPAGGNSAWWILEMESRPKGASVAGVTIPQINAALGRRATPWCAADAFDATSFSSSDSAVQADIRRTLEGPDGNIFRATTRMTGAPLLAVVGNYRTCTGEAAPFLLLIDSNGRRPRIAYVRAFDDWTPFIAMRTDGNRLIVGSCLECDHAEILSWNRRARRFYWRVAGP